MIFYQVKQDVDAQGWQVPPGLYCSESQYMSFVALAEKAWVLKDGKMFVIKDRHATIGVGPDPDISEKDITVMMLTARRLRE